jgi:alkylation response protein AidB-like acyl-CoA dehydrogenase/flavin-dependent dehydrogenase/ferredoxin-like protein FixX
MSTANYDVIVVGAGAAGITAAIGLARAGFAVAVVEAAPFPGAENWSGCVYFCENLAAPAILGAEGVEALAWERRLVERGFFLCDGYSLLGMKYRDPEAFRHCYTVLRPIYDHHLAQVAQGHGVALLSATTAESLIRDQGRVIGIDTQRGPLYANLVFLAEGDASHLVTREGYERFTDQRETPRFLQGIKQVIELPAGAIEESFGLGAEEGAAYELLLRNGTLRRRPLHLNMGGFVYTNRQSLSIGLVLPVDNLSEHFEGDPNLLMEWFLNLPALKPWLREGRPGVFGAKLIRGGGARDIPTLIDDGLAVGGAASAIGVDFPYPNFTGPATAMGLQLVQAAQRIRADKGNFSREQLRQHYLLPLQETHYWQDVEFLRGWPGYVKRSQVFFERNIDLALASAYVWTRPRRWLLSKWTNWLRLLLHAGGPRHWKQLREDWRQLLRALRLRQVVSRPALGRLLLDGTINALRDLAGSPRPNLPTAGVLRIHYSAAVEAGAVGPLPSFVQRWFGRLASVLAPAARMVYANDQTSLSVKLPAASQLLIQQINLLDLLSAGALGLAALAGGVVLASWDRLVNMLLRRPGRNPRGIYAQYAAAATRAGDLTPLLSAAAQQWEPRLAHLVYETGRASHIHVLWPGLLSDRNAIVRDGLWHLCPAHVYEARRGAQGQLQVIVNFENCIKCETCVRGSELADWGRNGRQRFSYAVHSPVIPRLLASIQAAGVVRPAPPHTVDAWENEAQTMARHLEADSRPPTNGHDQGEIAELQPLLNKLEAKLADFEAALAEEPRTIDRARGEYLEMLARYAQQLATALLSALRESGLADHSQSGVRAAYHQLAALAAATLARAEERARRTWDQRFAWAAADGRQLRHHHLTGLRRFLEVLNKHLATSLPVTDPARLWLRAEDDAELVAAKLSAWRDRLDGVFGPQAWRAAERGDPLTAEQDAVLRDLVAQVPVLDPSCLLGPVHAPLRKALLAELGRRDPSLAYRVASHLWARDLARLRGGSAGFAQAVERWARGQEWACFVAIDAVQTGAGHWQGEALFVPAAGAQAILVLLRDQLCILSHQTSGLRVEPLATLGLRGAGLARLVLDNLTLPEPGAPVDRERVVRVWQVLSSADLTSIALGMADQLYQRALGHATSRVQFPGLFQDEEARDTIGKFGSVKKMVAELAAHRYLLETLDHALAPADFSAPAAERALLVKALAAEAVGTAPGSAAYNAGQIFGGTGYSEDDILSKYYRDASAWRCLGQPNTEIYRQHGEQVLRGWHTDGRRLAALNQEAQLFEQVVQRKALQGELDEIRVLRSQLRALANAWQANRREDSANPTDGPAGARIGEPAARAEVVESLARQDAHLLAAKVLLLRTHARLEHGLNAEAEIMLVRLWLARASDALHEFEILMQRQVLIRRGWQDRPLLDPGTPSPIQSYQEYLDAQAAYDSGDFLVKPVNPAQPRLVPELIESDPALAACQKEIRELLTSQFGSRRPGLPYERYVERTHRPDAEDLDFCRRHGFFRMTIPRELGGEGKHKVDYYILITQAQQLADVAVSLTIQVNTSIGTTPIFLARDKDLPRAQKELACFVGDPSLQREITSRLERLLDLAGKSSLGRFEQSLRSAGERINKTVLASAVLRALAHRFTESWHEALRKGSLLDMAPCRATLAQALEAWKLACGRAEDMHAELARRREACELFLRWIASGQISAFALTEPSAGSDTARVATRARVCSVPADRQPDGSFRFIPAGSSAERYLLDARRLVFQENRVYYRWSEQAAPARIEFDEYDYEGRRADGKRYYLCEGRRVHFTDITQIRERDGRSWYDYWELTGAKMWITNGRMAGVFCLYARTEEGVTGFLVDRHAEGLVVGKDEAKMGQQGSPTNELSLQQVRVPRENVLGLEGRGQVNALEALNVGRAGLAMTGMAQMAGIIERSRAFALSAFGEIPDWVAWRLERMEQIRFSAEALAHEVVGKFNHPQTRSIRLESAIAKMMVSELLQEVVSLAEDIHGLSGQTELHLLEKRKRDARVLTIYEGTNEIQRFFILKDLTTEVAPRWSARTSASLPSYLGDEALELESLRLQLRDRVTAALEAFGNDVWQNPSFQANCFLISEAVAWLKTADSTLGRLAWIYRQLETDEETGPSESFFVGRRAVARCASEVRRRLSSLDEELAHLRRGYYAPEIRAASLLFRRFALPPVFSPLPSEITRPLSILVVVEFTGGAAPQPQVSGGRLLEPHLVLTGADRSALETALRLRDAAAAPVTIQAAAVGPRRLSQPLRELLSLGIDRVRLVVCDDEALAPSSAAQALTAILGSANGFDLILGGGGDANHEEGLVAGLTAAGLGVCTGRPSEHLSVRHTETESEAYLQLDPVIEVQERPLPLFVPVIENIALRAFGLHGYLASLGREVEIERWPRKVPARKVFFHEQLPASQASPKPLHSGPWTPEAAARHALGWFGLSEDSSGVAIYRGQLADVLSPTLLDDGIVAVLKSDERGRLTGLTPAILRAAQDVARIEQSTVSALLLAPPDELCQRRALGLLRKNFTGSVVLLVAGPSECREVAGGLLGESLKSLPLPPRVWVGEAWAEVAFGPLGQRSPAGTAFRLLRVSGTGEHLILESARAGGKLAVQQMVSQETGVPGWITLADNAEVTRPIQQHALAEAAVERWHPRFERVCSRDDIRQLVEELPRQTGLNRLTDADFIIDVGFGVGNRDGYETVIEPLERALRELGVRNLAVGGSRKVTEELHLLPADRQIGQSGVRVNPVVLLAIGISGAPQHLSYIGSRTAILAFNRDPEAPLMTLNRQRPAPRVFPIPGDLFQTVPAFIQALKEASLDPESTKSSTRTEPEQGIIPIAEDREEADHEPASAGRSPGPASEPG